MLFRALILGAAVLVLTGCGSGSESADPRPSRDQPAKVATSDAQTAEIPKACPATPQQIGYALRRWIPSGELTPTPNDGATLSFAEEDETSCMLDLPISAFGGGDEFRSVSIEAHRYSANYTATSSGANFECQTGGSSPTEVFNNAVSCTTESEADSGRQDNVVVDRSIGEGFVSDGTVSATLAAPGEWWYDFTLSSVEPKTEFGPALIALAQLMLTHGHLN